MDGGRGGREDEPRGGGGLDGGDRGRRRRRDAVGEEVFRDSHGAGSECGHAHAGLRARTLPCLFQPRSGALRLEDLQVDLIPKAEELVPCSAET